LVADGLHLARPQLKEASFLNCLCATVCPMSDQSGFSAFWPAYVRAHRQPATRLIHCLGTLYGWGLLAAAITLKHWWWILAALFTSYALAWISHFLVEHNRPASFEHPLWSWWADQKMVTLMLTGKMDTEVRRYFGNKS
jgi:hypothetical protein